MKAMIEPRLAYLGIAYNPDLRRLLQGLSDDELASAYSLPVKQLAELLDVHPEFAADVSGRLRGISLDKALARLHDLRIDFITRADAEYPDRLRYIYDPPACLFVKGTLIETPRVAVVGARRCTPYGQAVAGEIAAGLARAGLTVVSGMARGIDTAAHRGALIEGETIAVLGCGLDIVYPPENRNLADEIARSGALLSEYPPGFPPRPMHFPARNRIISGLSEALVVVEAGSRSGALITADLALEQGREVMVVPGSVRSPASSGCHRLIKQGAALVSSADDVLEVLGLVGTAAKDEPQMLSGAEIALLSVIDYDRTHIDSIMGLAGQGADKVLGDLSLLEARGLVGRHPGGWFYRLK